MKERPIIFKMIRAILYERKTQTRRVIKPQPDSRHCQIDFEGGVLKESSMLGSCWHVGKKTQCPYGRIGDKLYVKESFQINWWCAKGIVKGIYLADNAKFEIQLNSQEQKRFEARKYPARKTSGRFMYKSLTRIWLEITNIRVERVQDITDDDAKAEGVDTTNASIRGYLVKRFHKLWDLINAKRGYGTNKNPWVWVVEFKKL